MRVSVVKVEEIDWARLNGGPLAEGEQAYLTATFRHGGERFFGRTPVFPRDDAGVRRRVTLPTDFASGGWIHDVSFASGDALEILVSAWIDAGDAAPRRVAETFDSIYYHEDDDLVSGDTTEDSRSDSGIHVHYNVRIYAVPPDAALAPSVARSVPSESVQNVVDVRYAAVTRITHVRGLYQPRGETSAPVGGYVSADDAGRIFTNQDPTGAALDGDQWIEIRAEATFVNPDVVTGRLSMQWRVLDHHDDPSNDHPNVHREAGRVLDPKDYDGYGKHIGYQGTDNEGTYTGDLFRALPEFAIQAQDARAGTARTAVKHRGFGVATPVYSEVRLQCPTVAGDRFSVEARLVVEGEDEDDDEPLVFPHETGIMTMWKRVPVDVFRMRSAFALDTAAVAREYRECFVQLEFGAEQLIDDCEELSKHEGGADAFVTRIAGPPRYPPRFVLLLALHHEKVERRATLLVKDHPTKIMRTAVTSEGRRIPCEAVSVPGKVLDAKRVSVNWGAAENARKAIFSVKTSAYVRQSNITWLYLEGQDVTQDFTGADADGSSEHAYRSQMYLFARGLLRGDDWSGDGYGAPEDVVVRAQGPGGAPTAGLSPTVAIVGRKHFAGRTIVYTHHGTYNEHFGTDTPPAPRGTFTANAGATLIHEFCHAFGMPHKCAYWDYKTPRTHSCTMNYDSTWIMDAASRFTPTSAGKMGPSLCGRHMKEVRRVLLHKNPVYRRG